MINDDIPNSSKFLQPRRIPAFLIVYFRFCSQSTAIAPKTRDRTLVRRECYECDLMSESLTVRISAPVDNLRNPEAEVTD